MNGPVWVGWLLFSVLAVISIVLLMGKGSFLIAGYNTSGKEKKERFNEKRLCRVMGGGLLIITAMMGVSLYYENQYPYPVLELMSPWGLLLVIAVMIVLANTVCKRK